MLQDFREFEGFLTRFTNYERFRSFPHDKDSPGLERMRLFAAEIGNPQESFRAVHIAGTKGKGSTSLILEALLRAEGLRVVTYMSPHVEHLRERIRIDGGSITETALLGAVNAVLPVIERLRSDPAAYPSFFELMTGVAMSLCRSERVDWGIFEVGLGGRLDATNILEPSWTAITSIGLEHTQQLGTTLEKIAGEKAGIIKHATPVVLGPLPPPARAVIEAIARDRQAPVVNAGEGLVRPAAPSRLRLEGHGILPAGRILGPALRTDLGIALTLHAGILEAGGRRPSADVIRSALLGVELPARVEVVSTTPPIVLDAAHTAESIQALRWTLDEIHFPAPRTLVFSISMGKELVPILAELPGLADEIILTSADAVRSVPPEEIRALLGHGAVVASPDEAFDEALRRGRPIVVTGSFYLAGALRPRIRELSRAQKSALPGAREAGRRA